MQDSWKNWGKRFRVHAKENGVSLRNVAERLEIAESTVRSWTNGTRDINLVDYFRICEVANVDALHVLFGKVPLSPDQKAKLGELVAQVLEADPSTNPDYAELVRSLDRDMKKKRGR